MGTELTDVRTCVSYLGVGEHCARVLDCPDFDRNRPPAATISTLAQRPPVGPVIVEAWRVDSLQLDRF